MKKKTVILGATTKPTRFAYLAAERLSQHGHPFVPIGIKKGEIFGEEILNFNTKPQIENVDTVTLYIGPKNQEGLFDYIKMLNPARVIFNPGTENNALIQKLQNHDIQTLEACTLVMLSIGTY